MVRRKKCILALDIGGTNLKWTLIYPPKVNNIVTKECFHKVIINSNFPAELIINIFLETIKTAFDEASIRNTEIIGMGVSVPGPFDLKEGISLLRHKYRDIYEVNLREVFLSQLKLPDSFLIHFEYDSEAFLIGEANYGNARGFGRIIGLTLGTGLGSAFMVGGNIVEKDYGIPSGISGNSLWRLPIGNGLLDDIISKRGILRKYRELGGKKEDLDVKDISSLAFEGDTLCQQVFKEFGATFGTILTPIVSGFKPDCIIFGGQISKSFALFSEPLRKELKSILSIKKIDSAKYIDLAPLFGIAKNWFSISKQKIKYR